MRHSIAWTALLASSAGLFSAENGCAALYWFQGVRSTTPSVCFVGDALTSRPDRVAEIMAALKRFEYVANIRFDFLGACPDPAKQSDGHDFHDGDIRVVIPSTAVSGTGEVPGEGCTMFLDQEGNYNGDNDGWRSWSNAPNDLELNRACLYNLKLGDDPWSGTPYLNHTLHEFGHALGLSHEHERDDANVVGCSEAGYRGTANQGKITSYDRYSVMSYQFSSCGIDGNYGYGGLSSKDQTAFHIMYPEKKQVAEVYGKMVLKTTEPLGMALTWEAMGANTAYAVKKVTWQINGKTVSTLQKLSRWLLAGKHNLRVMYSDFLDRTYSWDAQVEVLSPVNFNRYMGSQVAARSAALSYVPLGEIGW
jgi:hypothetical protein